jgi:hypothetical protein
MLLLVAPGAPPPHPIYGAQMIYSDPRHAHPHAGTLPTGGTQRGDGTPAIDPSLDASASGAVAMAAAGAVPVLVPLHPALAIETAMEAVLQCAKRDPAIMAQLDKQKIEGQDRQVAVGTALSNNGEAEVGIAPLQQSITQAEIREGPEDQAVAIVLQVNSTNTRAPTTESGVEIANPASLSDSGAAMDIDVPSRKEQPEGSGGGDEDAEGEFESVDQEDRPETHQATPAISSAVNEDDKQSMTPGLALCIPVSSTDKFLPEITCS